MEIILQQGKIKNIIMEKTIIVEPVLSGDLSIKNMGHRLLLKKQY
jgi:hypothetical protein